jgi:hypothetical protein
MSHPTHPQQGQPNSALSEHADPQPATPESDARPFWLNGPCPAWCTSAHLPSDHPEDRAHWSATWHVPLLLAPAARTVDDAEAPQRLKVTLWQPYRDAEPTVLLGTGDAAEREAALTPDEARFLARVLRETAAAATTSPAPAASACAASREESGRWLAPVIGIG